MHNKYLMENDTFALPKSLVYINLWHCTQCHTFTNLRLGQVAKGSIGQTQRDSYGPVVALPDPQPTLKAE